MVGSRSGPLTACQRADRREDLGMNFMSVRVITEDVALMVEFYERVTGGSASWANAEFAEVHTRSCTLAIGSTRTVGLFGPGSASPATNLVNLFTPVTDDALKKFADTP